MTPQKLFAWVVVPFLILACGGYHRPEFRVPGDRDDLAQYVSLLKPGEKGTWTRSFLLIQLDGREEVVTVARAANEYQVTVYFCPEARETQERQLVEFLGKRPDSWKIEERACGGGSSFHLASSAEVVALVEKSLEVLGVSHYHCWLESGILK